MNEMSHFVFSKSRKLLSQAEAQQHLDALNQFAVQYLRQENFWRIDDGKLCAHFSFATPEEKSTFQNAVAELIKSVNHHPQTAYSKAGCDISYITHSADGLTGLDFYCAAKLSTGDVAPGGDLPTS